MSGLEFLDFGGFWYIYIDFMYKITVVVFKLENKFIWKVVKNGKKSFMKNMFLCVLSQISSKVNICYIFVVSL